jgi:signal transduction histidine kinase
MAAALIGVEIAATLALALLTGADFFVFVFAIPCMQVMQRFGMRATAVVLGLTTLLTLLALMPGRGALFAVGMAVVFFGGTVLLVAYIRATQRASRIEAEQQALLADLRQANERLQTYSRQMQDLAAGRERQRLARELHDSVTQTIFSMTLTTQSALLLLERDWQQVGTQLERLNELTESTLAEMQTLISRLRPEQAGGRFVADLKEHLEERQRRENLAVSLEAEGNEALEAREEAGLFRIAQEALNNVVKHAQVSEAVLRLHLAEPFWMEIEDRGIGFDARAAQGKGKLGLEGMRERAEEMGWCLEVQSTPPNGTRIRVKKEARGG